MAEIILKEVCKRLGLSQREVAERMGVTPSVLNMRINSNNPTLKSLEEIANALGVGVKELIKDDKSHVSAVCPHCGKPIKISISIPNE